MNEPDLQALERRLHTLPPLLDVPAEPGRPIRPGRRRRSRLARPDPASATPLARMVTPLVARGRRRDRRRCGGRGDHHRHIPARRPAPGFSASRPSPAPATPPATSRSERADGAVEPVVVSISHLDPAPGDQYYEIWFKTGGQDVPGVAFNAGSNGTAEVHLTAPTNTKWVRCWITRQSISDPGSLHHRHARQPGPSVDLAMRRLASQPTSRCLARLLVRALCKSAMSELHGHRSFSDGGGAALG